MAKPQSRPQSRPRSEVAADRAREKNRKDQEALDLVFAALSHPTRRQILLTLKIRGDSMSSGDIAERYSCSWPTVTRHLNVLKEAGLIVVQRQGKTLQYQLNKDALAHAGTAWLALFQGG